ncbi:MAG TPA: xanthine dehydrogenase family protein subunit M [Terriglobia bacterium]|nr:xanthine dehydrogenase family protein subunit M [Terriglobia bacterium]
MYPAAFRYHRASSLEEAVTMLSELGEEARLLAGGQSLIPLMKLRLARPSDLVDLSFAPGLSYIRKEGRQICFGAMTRHAEIETSDAASHLPILHDCAAGIADVQVRNRGTIGGSLAEADPSGDWGPVLLTHPAEVRCVGPNGTRTIPLNEFFRDAYTSALAPGELIREIAVHMLPHPTGGAYLAVKRCAQVYATASVAVRLTLGDKDTCREAGIALGCVGLTPIKAVAAEKALAGQKLTKKTIEAAEEAAMAAADPQPDMRGSAEYKRAVIGALVKRAIEIARRRAGGERVEVSHYYA